MEARDYINNVEEEESYFVSMTDVIIGLLFIFIIMLMFFAMRFQEETQKQKVVTEIQNSLIDDLTDAEKARGDFLESIGRYLQGAGMNVVIVKNEGILRLPEEILFDISKWELNAKGVEAVRTIAKALELVLPCYTAGSRSTATDCPSTKAKIDAIFIEGHADASPFHRAATGWSPSALGKQRSPASSGSPFDGGLFGRPSTPPSAQSEPRRPAGVVATREPPKDNLDLSALRATSTFRELLRVQPGLSEYRSPSNKPVLSVSGYGEYRPVAPEEGESAERFKQRNRRIDLRVLMATPKSEEAKQLQKDLQQQGTRP